MGLAPVNVMRRIVVAVVLCLTRAAISIGEPVTVRFKEGLVHGFLSLSSLDGTRLAHGDLIQTVRGDAVTGRLVFHFADGSLHDETTVFSQGRHFRLVRDRLVQRGPSFPRPLDMTVDAESGNVTVKHSDEHGKEKSDTARFDMPPDLANGALLITMLKNVGAGAPPQSLSMIVATPKPRLVKLEVSKAGAAKFSAARATHSAIDYVLHVNIGGLSGLLAPLVGKQPPDFHVWILGGEAPAFIKTEQPFYAGGPVWRIELVSPQMTGQ
jgi:hypothetical protein